MDNGKDSGVIRCPSCGQLRVSGGKCLTCSEGQWRRTLYEVIQGMDRALMGIREKRKEVDNAAV